MHWAFDLTTEDILALEENPKKFLKKKGKNEVTIRTLSDKERENLRSAKMSEAKSWVENEVIKKAGKPISEKCMKLRWVITWKTLDDGSRGLKARLVVLGYQDPTLGEVECSAPTMQRRTRGLFIQQCVERRWTLVKGDVKKAFLQGRPFEEHLEKLIEPVPELCEALDMKEMEAVRLNKAAYGLAEAPLRWYQTCHEEFTKCGGRRLLSDECAWVFTTPSGEVYGAIVGHVDDFVMAGNASDPRWMTVMGALKKKWTFGSWETLTTSSPGPVRSI